MSTRSLPLPRCSYRKKPCTGAAAPTWWHSCRSPGRTAQGAPACWEGGKDRELCVHVLIIRKYFLWCFSNVFTLFIYVSSFSLFFICLLSLPAHFSPCWHFAGIHSIFREISDFKLSDFEGEAPWLTTSLPPGRWNLLKLSGSYFCVFFAV